MRVAGVETSVRCPALPSYFRFKDLVDFLMALGAMIIAAPLIGVLALLVRRDSPGPAFFRQTRSGRHARPFTLYKFRTMRADADPYGDSPQDGADPRITRLGRWLRESSLDELPQLFNVLCGHMSFVGPRPLYLQQIAEWDARQRGRLLVKPGLTGLAQINGRGSLTIEEKLEWDVKYVEAASTRTDVLILLRTFTSLWRRSGIYEVRYSATQERRSGG